MPASLLEEGSAREGVVLAVPGRGDVPMLQVMAEAGVPPNGRVYVKENGGFVDARIVDALAEPVSGSVAEDRALATVCGTGCLSAVVFVVVLVLLRRRRRK